MTRRALTLTLAGVLALLLAVAGGVRTVPYVQLSPGPAYDTLGEVGGTPVLSISGRETFPADGTLDLTTVSVRQDLTLFEALKGWVSRSDAVVPREILFPPDQTPDQVDQENARLMTESQDSATTAALRALKIPGTVVVVVGSVTKGGPAAGALRPGDVVTTVDGAKVTSSARLRELIGMRAAGDAVRIGYTRAGKAATATLTTTASPDTPVRPVIGIVPQERTDFPVKVTIALQDVGGPSAGLMFALGIIEKLGKDSLTGGRRIAGTGEIDAEGKVGPIGGIAQKLRGAKAQKATVFLVPEANCEEAADNRVDGLTLVRVGTLDEALAALASLRAGGTPPGC